LPAGYAILSALPIVVAMAAGCLIVIIGPALTVIHLISIPVANTSVNPARSMAVVAIADTAALDQLWLCWAALLAEAAPGAAIWIALLSIRAAEAPPAAGATPVE
jgi:aquaporin Z